MPLYFPGRKVNKRTLHAVLSAPPRLWVAPVDIFLSTVRPYWENERDPAKRWAHLTGLARQREVEQRVRKEVADLYEGPQ